MNNIYKSHKKVKSTPMTLGEYNIYRAWALPVGEDPQNPGYLIEYLDGGEPNDARHEGYISWSPKAQFDAGYTLVKESLEDMIQEKGLTAPRITIDGIQNLITKTEYHVFGGTQLTVCCLTLQNGFTVSGESACASPENFDKRVGESIALQDATSKIWLLEGYLLKQKLYVGEL